MKASLLGKQPEKPKPLLVIVLSFLSFLYTLHVDWNKDLTRMEKAVKLADKAKGDATLRAEAISTVEQRYPDLVKKINDKAARDKLISENTLLPSSSVSEKFHKLMETHDQTKANNLYALLRVQRPTKN
jgi:hypothetical protein